ncbi:hypothetical protein [Okeania sp. KiyG1]|uniref:hypothetical protein n=1 Tax=Okeania sp. KiyG1 TaxID=2720165 RepID=UPI00192497A8|nr:hypothetical protein [Okeania sp. KiyG1]
MTKPIFRLSQVLDVPQQTRTRENFTAVKPQKALAKSTVASLHQKLFQQTLNRTT